MYHHTINKALFIFINICLISLFIATPLVICKNVNGKLYHLKIGDQLLISIVGEDIDQSSQVVIRSDGMISYPIIGDVEAVGMTTEELSSVIKKKLIEDGYYKDPIITAQFISSSQEIIYVSGDVKEPGQKSFPKPINVVEALAAAGWFLNSADLSNARIIRPGQDNQTEVIPVDLKGLLKSKHSDNSIFGKVILRDGDILVIPSSYAEEQINIIGYVGSPGLYKIKDKVNIIEALALAGGAVEATGDLRNIVVIKSDGNIMKIDAAKIWDDQARIDNVKTPGQYFINPGDSIIVPEKGKIYIMGNVKTQGEFPVDGEIGILEALSMAGLDEGANLEKIKLIKKSGEKFVIDVSEAWDNEDHEIEDKVASGDILIVPTSFTINWSAISTIVLAISTIYAVFK
ncbi:hypothetical protein GF312_00750 [Candidatus Poribacteria bacterium]|nr:hypothetical protein [Candidatus Poribacteria bacterium]